LIFSLLDPGGLYLDNIGWNCNRMANAEVKETSKTGSWFSFKRDRKTKEKGEKKVEDETQMVNGKDTSKILNAKNSKSVFPAASPAPSSEKKAKKSGKSTGGSDLENNKEWLSRSFTDLRVLEEELIAFADDQPRVARCIPKGVPIDTSSFEARRMKDCIYDDSVYEKMLKDSMDVCELLQHKLDDYIVEVRKSPSRESGIENGIAEVNGIEVNGSAGKEIKNGKVNGTEMKAKGTELLKEEKASEKKKEKEEKKNKRKVLRIKFP